MSQPRIESVYLDTSVLNVYLVPQDPFLHQQTHLFWLTLNRFRVHVSDVVFNEVDAASEPRRTELVALLESLRTNHDLQVLSLTAATQDLAQQYIDAGVFSERDRNDALHVAAASAAGLDYLVSWNFRHLVRVKTRRMVNLINMQAGYKTVEIVAPSEL